MKVVTVAVLTCLLASESVSAQAGVELWRGLRSGMTKEQAGIVVPENEVDLLPDCRANASLRFGAAGLRSVTLGPKWIISKNNCIDPVRATLNEKYGPPSLSSDRNSGNQFKPTEDYVVSKWQVQGLQITFKEQVGGKKWNLTYEPASSTVTAPIKGL